MKKPPQWVAVDEERTAALAGRAGGTQRREGGDSPASVGNGWATCRGITHRPKFVKWLLPVRVDGTGLPSAFVGLHSIGRLATRTAPHRHRSVCRLSLMRSRAFGHAVAITSVPTRDADVMPLLRRARRLLNPAPLWEGSGPSYDALRLVLTLPPIPPGESCALVRCVSVLGDTASPGFAAKPLPVCARYAGVIEGDVNAALSRHEFSGP